MNTQKIYRRFKKNSKALSPVVASIILIAVTVAVSVVVAAWMGGMTIGLMGNAEQAQVTNVAFAAGSNSTLTATVRNTGDDTITISAAYIDGVKTSDTYATGNTIVKGASAPITITGEAPGLASGAVYEIKMVTAKGTSIIYSFNP